MDEVSVPAKTAERYELLRFPKRLMDKLRIISAASGKTMADLVAEYVGDRIDAEHRATIREQAAMFPPDVGGEG